MLKWAFGFDKCHFIGAPRIIVGPISHAHARAFLTDLHALGVVFVFDSCSFQNLGLNALSSTQMLILNALPQLMAYVRTHGKLHESTMDNVGIPASRPLNPLIAGVLDPFINNSARRNRKPIDERLKNQQRALVLTHKAFLEEARKQKIAREKIAKVCHHTVYSCWLINPLWCSTLMCFNI